MTSYSEFHSKVAVSIVPYIVKPQWMIYYLISTKLPESYHMFL